MEPRTEESSEVRPEDIPEEFNILGSVSPSGAHSLFPRERHYSIPRMVDPKSSVGIFELPAGVVYQGELLKDVHLAELDGEDEDILVSDATFYPMRLNAVLSRKITRLGTVDDPATIKRLVPMMGVLDRGTCIIGVRRITHGDIVAGIEIECPQCEQKFKSSPDLSSVTYFRPKDPMKLEWEFELPRATTKAGRPVIARWHVYDGERELRIAKVSKHIGSKDMLTWRIMARLLMVDGKDMELKDEHFTKDGKLVQTKDLIELFRAVKLMSQADRNALRNEFRFVEGDLDLDVTVTCPNAMCGHSFSYTIDITDRSFFFPQETMQQND